MPAYMKRIKDQCGQEGCERRATHEVRNGYNELYGTYCQKDAQAKVDKLNGLMTIATGPGAGDG